ncbi:MAG: CRISPR-associated helicase Cas3' [Alphaproteobacteria bacterium]|nr:CRISPR-associated helicase Cas3' [Alphaproteobacteria bacterium]
MDFQTNSVTYYAHSAENTGDKTAWQLLREHLFETGRLAGAFGSEFGAGNPARLAGLLHDLGKYTEDFQARLEGENIHVDHAAPGAVEVKSLARNPLQAGLAELVSWAIAGHHAGLEDYGKLKDRLAAFPDGKLNECWKKEVATATADLLTLEFSPGGSFPAAFLGRMIFSCLVDADFKDTERFYAKTEGRKIDRDWPDLRREIDALIARFDTFIANKRAEAEAKAKFFPLNELRARILDHVCAKADMPRGLFTLTVPTGGGKTLASLGFALKHAKAHNLRRIVYAIPFTSIIEQNAAVFRESLQDEGDRYILEHHSSIETEKAEEKKKEQKNKLRLAMEDWAAPLVVTTNVQFFESLFANRSSRCRKLHNLANSVIILDEAQTLPLKLLRPCMAALDELARHYGVSVVLCTATQPALDKRHFGEGGLTLEGRELAPDIDQLARVLRRTKIERAEKPVTDDDLVQALQVHDRTMTIVNSRGHALDLFKAAKRAGLSGLVHLTTRQCAVHRREILNEVRAALLDKSPCRLIATSLVEAGVDIDFPRVFRAETGLDQIAQAAGRCNREGRGSPDESIVTVFKPADREPPGEFMALIAAFERIAADFAPEALLSPEAIRAYFQEVYWQKGAERLDEKGILSEFTVGRQELFFNYRTAAEKFRMIEQTMAPVIIPLDGCAREILGRLSSPEVSPKKAMRELQPFIVQIPHKDRAALLESGRADHHYENIWGDQFTVLTDDSLYTKETGLFWEGAEELHESIF